MRGSCPGPANSGVPRRGRSTLLSQALPTVLVHIWAALTRRVEEEGKDSKEQLVRQSNTASAALMETNTPIRDNVELLAAACELQLKDLTCCR